MNEFDEYLKPVLYKKGDLLLIKNEPGNKFDNVYDGPFKVLDHRDPDVRILRNNEEKVIHKNRTK